VTRGGFDGYRDLRSCKCQNRLTEKALDLEGTISAALPPGGVGRSHTIITKTKRNPLEASNIAWDLTASC
jgi:hypothetical protein